MLNSIERDRLKIFDINGEYTEFGDSAHTPDSIMDFDLFCKEVWRMGNIFLGVDEADMVLPSKQKIEGYPYKIIHLGRHRNIGGIFITRRLANLSKDVFGLSDHIFIFRHFSPNDILYLKEFIGDKADKVRELKDWHFYYYNHKELKLCSPITIGKI
jgi:DNA helicase HerA-like ATPase